MNPWQARLAVRTLRRGGLVLHATEGVWGLACDPWDPSAVHRLLAAKRRREAKGLILIGACAGCFAPELRMLVPSQRTRVEESWPGPVTWVLPNHRFPQWITGGRDTVAVRVPGHVQARELCRAWGGLLVSTSANRASRPSARNRFQAHAVAQRLCGGRRNAAADLCDIYLLPGETSGRRAPSEIRTPAGVTLRGRSPAERSGSGSS